MALKITKNEFILAAVFALMGFILSEKSFIAWLDSLTPLAGLAVYYGIIFISLMIMSYFGLVIGNIKLKSVLQTLGILLIIFSFEIVTDWESCYVPQVLGEKCTNADSVFVQSEDGSVFWLAQHVTDNIQTQRILTYVLAPFILTLLGALLVSEKLRIGYFT